METGGRWSELPVDVKAEIFGRIPEDKELISLKVICKDWNFVISRFCVPNLCPPNPRAPISGVICFHEPLDRSKSLTLRFVPNTNILRFIVKQMEIEASILSIIPSQEHEADSIRDCCNGMILMMIADTCQYTVANFLTGQRFHVPVSPNRSTIHCSLVFDPSIVLCDGKDPFFKIVSFVRPAEEATVSHPMEVDIYASDEGEWCTHVVDLEPHHLYGFAWLERSVYFNRALYSLSLAMYLVCIDNVIPAPNSGTKDLRVWTLALPDRDELIPNARQFGCIGNCSGRFYYSNRNVQGSHIPVWMLRNSSEWVLMHNISIRQDINSGTLYPEKIAHDKKLDCFRPRAFHPQDGNGMTIDIVLPRSYYSYNVITKQIGLRFVKNPQDSPPWNKFRLGDWFFPLSLCPLLLNATTKT